MKVLMTLMRNGKAVPFGSVVTARNGGSSIAGENGQVYLSGMPLSDHWHVPEYRHSAHNTVAGSPHCDCILHWHYRIPLCNSERHILFYCSPHTLPGYNHSGCCIPDYCPPAMCHTALLYWQPVREPPGSDCNGHWRFSMQGASCFPS